MSGQQHPRYVVLSCTGYPVSGGSKQATAYWVSDMWWGYREVATFYGEWGGDRSLNGPTKRLQRAIETCARLNREHDAWLAETPC